jgi:hypothetical protein
MARLDDSLFEPVSWVKQTPNVSAAEGGGSGALGALPAYDLFMKEQRAINYGFDCHAVLRMSTWRKQMDLESS